MTKPQDKSSFQPPYKVLNYHEYFPSAGGIEQLLKNWYYTQNTGVWFDFAIRTNINADWNFINKVRNQGHVFLVNETQSYYNFPKLVAFYFRLYKTLRKGNYDLFLCHQPVAFPLLLLHCWVAKLAGTKNIAIVSHSTLLPQPVPVLKKRIFRFILPRCTTHRLAVSQRAGETLFGHGASFELLHPSITPRAFAFNEQLRQETRAKLGLQDRVVIGQIGRLGPEKNHAFSLKIFEQLHRLCPQARLVLVGNGKLRQTLLEQAQQLGIGEFVLFEGEQSNPAPYYQAFDAFLLPSFAEGLPLTLLEAQSSGLPCFVSDVVSPEAYICNVTPLSLQASPEVWAQTILNTLQHFKRTNNSALVEQGGFTPQETLNRLQGICKTSK